LLKAPAEKIERWALESAFFNKVYAYYEKHERVDYRSDSDYTGWL
jgi:hypothetical protein